MKEKTLWPIPQEVQYAEGACTITGPLQITGLDTDDNARLQRYIDRCTILKSLPISADSPVTPVRIELTNGNSDSEEYTLKINQEGISLSARSSQGLFRAVQTLIQLVSVHGVTVPFVFIKDQPQFPIRGFHTFLPAREELRFFFELLDVLAECKYNTLFLEIGGGMELSLHPEINRAWEDFCREADSYIPAQDEEHQDTAAGRLHPVHIKGATALQVSRWFPKNSTHTELAGGTWLKKDEVTRIIDACRERSIEIIPEVQSFSHSYYLCTAHPDIAELPEDPWPDTYCPSNPKSYELLFDVIDEVIEVFNPRTIHIGHDELYVLGHCPQCRKKDGHTLITEDVTKIHDYLSERGIRTMMWGDKLMNVPHGGQERIRRDEGSGREWKIPASWKAVDRVPKDIIILDWYWEISQTKDEKERQKGVDAGKGSIDPESDRYFEEHGFRKIYGNFGALDFSDWENRANSDFVLGAEVSSWCGVTAEEFSYNRIISDIFPAANLLWNGSQLSIRKTSEFLSRWYPPIVDRLLKEHRYIVSGSADIQPLDLTPVSEPLPEELQGRLQTGGIVHTVLGTGGFPVDSDREGFLKRAIILSRNKNRSTVIPVEKTANGLLLLQGTNMEDVYLELTFNSYHRNPAGELLVFTVTYEDDTDTSFPGEYGVHIGYIEGFWPFPYKKWMYNTCYRSVPAALPNDKKLFVQEWRNPWPNKRISTVTVSLGPDAKDQGSVLIAGAAVF